MGTDDQVIERCSICLQPTTADYKFNLSYFEDGKEVTRSFCGATCLKKWIEGELDKVHLNLCSLE